MKKQFIFLFLILVQACGSASSDKQEPSQSSQASPREEGSSSPIVEPTVSTLTVPDTPVEVIPATPVNTPLFTLKPKGIVKNGWDSWVGSSADGYCFYDKGSLKPFHSNALSREQVVDSLKFPLDIARTVLLVGSWISQTIWDTSIQSRPEYIDHIEKTAAEIKAEINNIPNPSISDSFRIGREKGAKTKELFNELKSKEFNNNGNLVQHGLSIAFYAGLIIWTYAWVNANLEFDDITAQNIANWNPSDLEKISTKLKDLTPATSLSCQ